MNCNSWRKGLWWVTSGLLVSAGALAQEVYPSRAITLIVPFAAGSGADISARLLAKSLNEGLKANVIVDNRPGANGAIGAQAAARSKPDGYTLMMGSATTNATNFAFSPGGALGYEPTSFDFIGGMGSAPVSLYVSAESTWKSLAELVAEAKLKPGRLSCGSGNSVTQVACEVFKRQAGIDVVTVPYKSNPQSLTDLVGRQITFAFADSSVSQAFLDSKKIRAMGVAAASRNPATPEAATFHEQGYADFEITAWTVVFAPAGTPVAIAEKLNAALVKFANTPESVQLRARTGSLPLMLTLAEGKRFLANEVTRWARYVKDSGIKPEQ